MSLTEQLPLAWVPGDVCVAVVLELLLVQGDADAEDPSTSSSTVLSWGVAAPFSRVSGDGAALVAEGPKQASTGTCWSCLMPAVLQAFNGHLIWHMQPVLLGRDPSAYFIFVACQPLLSAADRHEEWPWPLGASCACAGLAKAIGTNQPRQP